MYRCSRALRLRFRARNRPNRSSCTRYPPRGDDCLIPSSSMPISIHAQSCTLPGTRRGEEPLSFSANDADDRPFCRRRDGKQGITGEAA